MVRNGYYGGKTMHIEGGEHPISETEYSVEGHAHTLAPPHIHPKKANGKEKGLSNGTPVSRVLLKTKEGMPNISIAAYSIASENSASSEIFERLRIQKRKSIQSISNLLLHSSRQHPSDEKKDSDSENHISLLWLREKGYDSLATKLETNHGYPWDHFKKLRNPIFIEQLVDIYLLSLIKINSEVDRTKMIAFALDLIQKAEFDQLSEDEYDFGNDVRQILGQWIYLINKIPKTAFELIENPDFSEVLENIQKTFMNQIQIVCEKLPALYNTHAQTLLQDPEIAMQTQISVQIAKALLIDIGTINSGIIDSLSNIFLTLKVRPLNHEINIFHTLKLLQDSPKFRNEIENIDLSHPTRTIASDIVKATLDLSAQQEIQPFDGRLTALIAMLSHLRQGGDRSCFAVSLAIEMLSSHLNFCLKDLRQLLEEGKLSRKVKNVKKDVLFTKRISDENLHKKITFDRSGVLWMKDKRLASLWEAPGLISACRSIGIEDPQTTILETIKRLPKQKGKEFYTISIQTLISKICEQTILSSPSSSSLDQLYSTASFAFSACTTQPLLKVWENAIANMAEAEEGGMIKKAILEVILDSLQFKLVQLSFPPSSLLRDFFLFFQKLLYQNIRLQYDPMILQSSKNNENKIEGGFILYNIDQKIANEKSFRAFLHSLLKEVASTTRDMFSEESVIQELNKIVEILKSYLDTDEFMGYLLARYHPSNKEPVSNITHRSPLDYTQLTYTPWLTQTGNNSKTLLKIYIESDIPIQSEKFTFTEPEEALEKIIDMCKHMPEQEKSSYFDNPYKLTPFCILGKHRLPFMAGHPSIASGWQEKGITQTWIDQSVIDPGKEIGATLIDESTKARVNDYLKTILLQELSPNKIESILARIQENPSPCTVQQYRNFILQSAQSLPQDFADFTRKVDTGLCNSLDPTLKEMLAESAVHFADTNWRQGAQDIHFCFLTNPGSGKLELWEIYADGSHLTALDQDYWLRNQKWEFFTFPKNLVPDDSTYTRSS